MGNNNNIDYSSRPQNQPKYQPHELEEALFGPDGYFDSKEKKRQDQDMKTKYLSISNACKFLKIAPSTWRKYRKRNTHRPVIKRAENVIFDEWKKNLFYPGRNATGAMFYLKNTLGWADKKEVSVQNREQLPSSSNLEELPPEKLDKLSAAFEALEDKENAIDVTPED